MKLNSTLIAFAIMVHIVSANPTDPLDNWHSTGNLELGLVRALGEGLCVATTPRSVITQSEGSEWRTQLVYSGSTTEGAGFSTVEYANSRWVLTVEADPFFISSRRQFLTSTNGADWETDLPWGFSALFRMSFGNGRWVVEATRANEDSARLFWSEDEVLWTPVTLPSGTLYSLSFDAGEWLATLEDQIYASSDAVHWAFRSSLPHEAEAASVRISFGGGTWLLSAPFVDLDSASVSRGWRYWTSTDATRWQPLLAKPIPSSPAKWIDGKWIAWSSRTQGEDQREILSTSTNLLDWTPVASKGPNRSLAYGQGKWLGLGDSNALLSSDDARFWTVATNLPPEQQPIRIRFGNGLWVIAGYLNFTNIFVLTSRDGQNWSCPALPDAAGQLESLRFSDGKWTLAYVPSSSQTLRLLESNDGVDWAIREIFKPISNLIYADEKWLAIGRSSDACDRPLLLSSNLTDWQTVDVHAAVHQLEYANGLYYGLIRGCTPEFSAQGYGVVTSTDGMTWTLRYTGVFTEIAMANGRLAVLTEYGGVFQSDPLLSLHFSPAGDLAIRRTSGIVAQIEGSTDLSRWLTLTNIPVGDPLQTTIVSNSLTDSFRFFRARTP